MARMQKTKYHRFVQLDGGVDQFHDPIELSDKKLQFADNVHIDGGTVRKRPGKMPWGAQFTDPINGIYEYIDRTGTSQILVASGTDLYTHSASSSSVIDATISDEKIYFHTLRGKCFYNGATTQNRKLVGSTVSDVGIARPTTASVVATGAAGVLTGSYGVVVTYVTSDGLESNPCDVSNSVTLTNQQLGISSIPVSPDARVSSRKIYRSTAGGSRYWLIGTIADNTTTTYSDNTPDDQTGDEVQYNHGQPVQGSISTSANDRQFWVDGSKIRYSEIAQTDAYVEYQKSTSFIEMPSKGVIVGFRALYNENTQREDLYIFTQDSIVMLPQGDPNAPIVRISDTIGLRQQNTVVEYKNWLIFMDNENGVNMLLGRKILNISRRSIPVALKAASTQGNCSASIVFDHFFALTIRSDKNKLYNTTIWLCDLRSVEEVQLDQADAIWFPYALDAQYLLQRADGTVLYADTHDLQVYSLDFTYSVDTEVDLSTTNWLTQFQTKNFLGDSLQVRKQPRVLSIDGSFEKSILCVPYAFSDQKKNSVEFDSVGTAFIMGTSKMGDPMTLYRDELEGAIDSDCIGNTFSFIFYSAELGSDQLIIPHKDALFDFNGFDFTYKVMLRNI